MKIEVKRYFGRITFFNFFQYGLKMFLLFIFVLFLFFQKSIWEDLASFFLNFLKIHLRVLTFSKDYFLKIWILFYLFFNILEYSLSFFSKVSEFLFEVFSENQEIEILRKFGYDYDYEKKMEETSDFFSQISFLWLFRLFFLFLIRRIFVNEFSEEYFFFFKINSGTFFFIYLSFFLISITYPFFFFLEILFSRILIEKTNFFPEIKIVYNFFDYESHEFYSYMNDLMKKFFKKEIGRISFEEIENYHNKKNLYFIANNSQISKLVENQEENSFFLKIDEKIFFPEFFINLINLKNKREFYYYSSFYFRKYNLLLNFLKKNEN